MANVIVARLRNITRRMSSYSNNDKIALSIFWAANAIDHAEPTAAWHLTKFSFRVGGRDRQVIAGVLSPIM